VDSESYCKNNVCTPTKPGFTTVDASCMYLCGFKQCPFGDLNV
jgi:hypothetical protein